MENINFTYKSEISNPELTKQLESSEIKKKLESDFYKNAKINKNSSDLNEAPESEITEQNSIESAKKELESDFYKNAKINENSSDLNEAPESEITEQNSIESAKKELESDFYKNTKNIENSFDKLENPETDVSETQKAEDIRDKLESDFYKNRDSLTEKQKSEIKNETGWSDKIIESISNMDQYNIVYKPAKLEEKIIDDRSCLVKKDIDPNYKNDKTGETNRERMEKGLSPYDSKTGEKIELHHMQQKADSPLVHLLENSEHGKYSNILHENGKESFRRNLELKDRYNLYQRPNHWKEFIKEQIKNE